MTNAEREERRRRWRLLLDWADVAYFTGTGCVAVAGFHFAAWAALLVVGVALIAWALLIARR